jgi:hypothetical protein
VRDKLSLLINFKAINLNTNIIRIVNENIF